MTEVDNLKERVAFLEARIAAADQMLATCIRLTSDAMIAIGHAEDVVRLLSPSTAEVMARAQQDWRELIAVLQTDQQMRASQNAASSAARN